MRNLVLVLVFALGSLSADAQIVFDANSASSGDGCAVTGCAVRGIEGLPLSVTTNGITVVGPILDWRGKDCGDTSAAGAEGCSLASGQILTLSGASNITYGAGGGTNGPDDVGVTFVGTSNGDGYFSGIASDGDVTTQDILFEYVAKNGERTSPHMIVSKMGATDGYWFFDSTAHAVGLTTSSTATTLTPAYASTGGAGNWEYCTVCVDRSSASGTSMFCNGQVAMSGSSHAARSATLTNTSNLGVGGTNDSGTHFVYNGTISMARLFRQAGWFASSESECKVIHRDHIRRLSDKHYLFIGDSTSGGDDPTHAQRRFPSLYGESATAVAATVNAGEGGKRCDEMISREWETEKALGYSRLYLMCGINDVGADRTALQIETSITTMVTEAQASGMIVTVMTPTPFKDAPSWSAPRQVVLDTLNTWILANTVGAEYVVDFYSATEGVADTLAVGVDSGDHIHGNQAYHTSLAAVLAAEIAP